MLTESKKTKNLFRKYGLDVHSFETRDFLSPHYLFPYEENFKEIRVHLGAICDEEWLRSMYSVTTVKEYVDKYSKDDRGLKEFKEDLKKSDEKYVREIEESLTFSIFIKDDEHLSINKEEDVLFAYESAFNYMLFLCCIPQVCREGYGDDSFPRDVESFVEVLDYLGIKITNDNLTLIPQLTYRLYKDSKFFYELSEFLGDRVKEKFVEEFFNLVQNPEN